MRILLTIQYLGTNYGGWQLQAGTPTVQQAIEGALAQMFHEPIRLHGAGRTDAGVHAAGQRAHADVPFAIPPRGLVLGLNHLLPSDIRVIGAEVVPDDFHCRFAARAKTYSYRIWNSEVADVFAAATHAHVAQPLDVEAMHEAAQMLVGTHDFRVFTVAGPEVSSTVRTIESISVTRSGETVTITVTANGFLRYMVRRISGSLIEIGRGRLDRDSLWQEARWTAVPRGLVLASIRYEEEKASLP